MALTKKEMEAKLAALEDRIDLLSRFMETLEEQLQFEAERWKQWEEGLWEVLVAMGRQFARFREKVSPPRE